MKIGMVCYPTYGGSGVVATELGKGLAKRGHEIHFMSYKMPMRLNYFCDRIFFHEVEVPLYPLFEYPPYMLSLASKMVEVIEYQNIEILHVHYCIPHSISGYIAKQITDKKSVKLITTLHGTDITLVGNDPSFLPVTKFGIEVSDGVTAVSNYLRNRTYEEFKVKKEIQTIYNFVDTKLFKRIEDEILKKVYAPKGEKIIVHISNFRPIKRIDVVIKVFNLILKEVDSILLLIGDGPERTKAEIMCRELNICHKVKFLGKQDSIVNLLSISDLFLMPSELESFGLSALEAMSCAVPVIASDVGGLGELVVENTGYLINKDDIVSMAEKGIEILTDSDLKTFLSENARKRAEQVFDTELIIPQYEKYYKEA
jgi:N-acetyl-alpha-D-glucosaminyl L-malate synthase BshA